MQFCCLVVEYIWEGCSTSLNHNLLIYKKAETVESAHKIVTGVNERVDMRYTAGCQHLVDTQ